MTGQGVPNTDIVLGASGEQLGKTSGESNIVNLLVVAGVTELGADLVSVAPVEGRSVSSSEEVGGVSSQSDGCNGAHNL